MHPEHLSPTAGDLKWKNMKMYVKAMLKVH